MENTEIHYEMRVRIIGQTEVWNEKMDQGGFFDEPQTNEQAIEIAKKEITYSNEDLRPGEFGRELVNVQRIETKVIDLMEEKL